MSGLARLGIRVLDALLPPHCLTCEAEVGEQGTLCEACHGGLAFLAEPLCPHCGVPLGGVPLAAPAPLCPGCEESPPAFAAARAALRYDAAAQRLLLPFKYADRTEYAGFLARQMARAGTPLLARADLIAPVPLHWRRQFARRYNQAGLLAARLARQARKPYAPRLLRRIRRTVPLGELGAAEREEALQGAFALGRRAAPRIAGRRVLLVDDILTSGATADACALVLLAAGAAAVDVLAAARVPDPRIPASQ
ncbi:ComF family protein [Belnapia sp. F-4-1]|uniref:ComF family protein n=1 Tax=Belnapia sp. F-4-1 TaxID=1545443 RepID=UPI0006924A71|nr:double zinc ribbon domain-containing protein [Belnapia sp. F-4-1]